MLRNGGRLCIRRIFISLAFLCIFTLPSSFFVSELNVIHILEFIDFVLLFDGFLRQVMLKVALLRLMLLLSLLNSLRDNTLEHALIYIDRAVHKNASIKQVSSILSAL